MPELNDRVYTFTDSVIRLHFAREKKTIDEALRRLKKLKNCQCSL